jgi:predicted N-acetyltransferase YhbS
LNLETISLRKEAPADNTAVETLIREAFWNQYAPGCTEHYLAHVLRQSPDFVPELDILAEADGRVIGSILYSRARILLDTGGELPVLSFGPIAVLPAYQKRGVGARLIAHTLTLAREAGWRAVLIYGDPAYYSHQGFVPAETYRVGTPDNQYLAPLQAYELYPGALANAAGRLVESSTFDVDEAAALAFDRRFPPKPKEEGNAAQKRFQQTLQMRRPRV